MVPLAMTMSTVVQQSSSPLCLGVAAAPIELLMWLLVAAEDCLCCCWSCSCPLRSHRQSLLYNHWIRHSPQCGKHDFQPVSPCHRQQSLFYSPQLALLAAILAAPPPSCLLLPPWGPL